MKNKTDRNEFVGVEKKPKNSFKNDQTPEKLHKKPKSARWSKKDIPHQCRNCDVLLRGLRGEEACCYCERFGNDPDLDKKETD